MRLNNLRFLNEDGLHDLWILNGKIAAIRPSGSATAEPSLDLNGALAFPGLINSHDHLDFNLFPPLANRVYNSYTEWGPDIQTNNRASIDPILSIPQKLRTRWGIYKNLLNGFTTVVNHGEHLDTSDAPINVFQDCYCLHSVRFEPNWKWKLNHPAKTARPFAIHVGEGTDPDSTREIDELIRWNLFRRPLIGIHGVAMTGQQAASFRALVWCPASNFFLLNRTAPLDCLYDKVPILFGTDSTLTSGWNAWDQIRMARSLEMVPDTRLFAMLTTNPAAAWELNGRGNPTSGKLTNRGTLAPGKIADIVIARPQPRLTGMDALFALNPQGLLLVIHEGNIRLFDPSLLEPITEHALTDETFQPTPPDGKYVVGDLPGLMQNISSYCTDVSFW